jgi:tetratricopeptide (TPR) repeat protein
VIDAEERIASLYRDTGREPEAVRMYHRLLAANRATGDPRRTALTLVRLGGLLTATGAPAEAVDHLLEARAIFRELGAADPYNRQRTEIALARAYLAQHALAEAAETAAGAAAGMRGLGSLFEEAQALEVLARAARLRGDVAGADEHRARASRIYAGLDLPGPDGVEGEGGAAC